MRRTSGPALLLAGAYLTAGAFLVHAATTTVNHGGAPVYAVALYGSAALATTAAFATATGTRRPPVRPRPGPPDDLPPAPHPRHTPEHPMTDTTSSSAPDSDVQEPPLRPFHELRTSGLLWSINRHILHPRGVALALKEDKHGATGWFLMASPDGTPYTFAPETNEDGRARAEATLTAAGALPAHQGPDLPPFSGFLAVCVKCGYDSVSTEYQPPLNSHTMLRLNGHLIRGPLPERQQRECDRCRYVWLEAVGNEPETVAPLTPRELAYALDNSTPYPVELDPEVAAVMAAHLTQMIDAYPRPEHVVWDPDVQNDRPQECRPTPAEPAPPTEASTKEEAVAGLEDLEPERADLVRAVHAAMRELEDAHAHHPVPGVARTTATRARSVLRATALRLHRGEDAETVLRGTVHGLVHVLAGGDGITLHTLTGVDA